MGNAKRKNRRGKTAPAVGLSTTVKLAGGAVALIVSIGTVFYSCDSRYARAQDVDRKILALEKLHVSSERRGLESELRAAQREAFDIKNVRQKRKLSELENGRLDTVLETVTRIESEIKLLKEREKGR